MADPPVAVVPRPAHMPAHDRLGEGPFWDAATEALWWVDIIGRRVQRLDAASGEIRAWTTPSAVSAAIPRRDGGLVVTLADGVHTLDLGSGLTQPFAAPDPDPGNRSNEARTDPQGRLWLGTMSNNIAPDGSPVPLRGSTGGLFRVDADSRGARLLSGIGIANTLGWSPEGDVLYFADTIEGVIWRFAFDAAEGRVRDRRVFVEAGAAPGHPDGSAVDAQGRLWNARWGGGCVACFAPDGGLERLLEMPARQPTSVAFGGDDLATMYVTSAREGLEGLGPDAQDGALFAIDAGVPGLPMARFAG